MKEKLDQLKKNKTLDLIHRNNIEPSHRPLQKKCLHKLKCDVDSNIAYFKAK